MRLILLRLLALKKDKYISTVMTMEMSLQLSITVRCEKCLDICSELILWRLLCVVSRLPPQLSLLQWQKVTRLLASTALYVVAVLQ